MEDKEYEVISYETQCVMLDRNGEPQLENIVKYQVRKIKQSQQPRFKPDRGGELKL